MQEHPLVLRRDAQHRARPVGGHPLHIAQRRHEPLSGRQRLQRLGDELEHLARERAPLRLFRPRDERAGRCPMPRIVAVLEPADVDRRGTVVVPQATRLPAASTREMRAPLPFGRVHGFESSRHGPT